MEKKVIMNKLFSWAKARTPCSFPYSLIEKINVFGLSSLSCRYLLMFLTHQRKYICHLPYSSIKIIMFIHFYVSNRVVLHDLLNGIMSKREGYGASWHLMQQKLLSIYGEALSSNCRSLVQMIQVVLFFF